MGSAGVVRIASRLRLRQRVERSGAPAVSAKDDDTRFGHAGSRRSASLRGLRYPQFRRLLVARAMFGFANWMNRLAVGFLVLDETGSTFLTALSFAAQTAPGMVVAPFAGALSDRIDRRLVLALTALARVGVMTGLGLIVAGGTGSVWPLIALVAVGGAFASFDVPTSQALVTDIVHRRDAMNGIALQSVVSRAVGVVGALVGGILLDRAGGSAVFFTGATVLGIGVLIVMGMEKPGPRDGDSEAADGRGSVIGDVVDGLRVMGGLHTVRALLIMAVAIEILAFSYMSVMPVVAREVLGVGPVGLGALSTMAGVGSVIGSVGLAALGDYRHRGRLLLGASLFYGIGILAFSSSSWFPLSLAIVVAIGVMAATFDTLQWTLLQANVPDGMRGRVMGGWVFAVGFGWVGHLELGAVGGLIGVQWALAINGGLVIAAAIAAASLASRLRQA
jgi:MFS family permease